MRRPNILMLYVDQLRWDALRVNGNPDCKTPHLDRLAEDGVNFDRFIVQNPVCMPSRVSFLTGQYPSQLKITHMGVPVPAETVTLPKLLRNFGYTSANIGKLHFLPHANNDHRNIHPDYGFDRMEISDEPGCYPDAYHAWARRKAPEHANNLSVGLPPATEVWQKTMHVRDELNHPKERFPLRPVPFRGPSDLTHSAFVADETLQFLEEKRSEPFLCIAGFYSPHSPWVAPQEYFDLYDPKKLQIPKFPPDFESRRAGTDYTDEKLRLARQGYYGMVSEVDHYVGRILDTLDRRGLAQETIVIFTSDHGDWLGDHFKHGKGYPGDDAVTRVPFIVRYPDAGVGGGRTVSQLAEGVDVVPSLLEWCGIPVPGYLQGTSLVRTATSGEPNGKTSALTEMHGWKALRTNNFRYVLEANGREMLYDLERDPWEYADVSNDAAYAAPLSQHRKELARRLIQMERPLTRTWCY